MCQPVTTNFLNNLLADQTQEHYKLQLFHVNLVLSYDACMMSSRTHNLPQNARIAAWREDLWSQHFHVVSKIAGSIRLE